MLPVFPALYSEKKTSMYSDNDTNFVGARNFFFGHEQIFATVAVQMLRWKFKPSRLLLPDGLVDERLIQMAKGILRNALDRTSLSREKLVTILCHCEQDMNVDH